MIGYSDSNKESGFLQSAWALYRAQQDLVETGRRAGIDDADVPRPRRRDRPGRRAGEPGDPGPAARDDRRAAADDGAGGDDRRPLRPPRHRRAAPRAGRPRRAPDELRRRRPTRPTPPGPRPSTGSRRGLPPLPLARLRDARVPHLLPPGHADRGDGPLQDRLAPRPAGQLDGPRAAPRHPLGLQLDAVPPRPPRLVRPGQRGRGVPRREPRRRSRRSRRCTAAGRSGRR